MIHISHLAAVQSEPCIENGLNVLTRCFEPMTVIVVTVIAGIATIALGLWIAHRLGKY